jgi:TonB family protein
MTAAEAGHAECVTTLLGSGADPNVEASDGFTALIGARSNGHSPIAWALLDAGAVFTTNPGTMPELVTNPEIDVPDSLNTEPIEGSVVIQFIVDAEGKVEPESVEILESPHEGLNEPVKQVFLGAVYKPAQFEGKPVRLRIRQSMSFGG